MPAVLPLCSLPTAARKKRGKFRALFMVLLRNLTVISVILP